MTANTCNNFAPAIYESIYHDNQDSRSFLWYTKVAETFNEMKRELIGKLHSSTVVLSDRLGILGVPEKSSRPVRGLASHLPFRLQRWGARMSVGGQRKPIDGHVKSKGNEQTTSRLFVNKLWHNVTNNEGLRATTGTVCFVEHVSRPRVGIQEMAVISYRAK